MEEPELLSQPETDVKKIIDRVISILARRRWAVFGALPLAVLGTVIVLSLIPNTYRSEATLLVVQQQIPQRYVLPTSTTDMREALQATTEEVLSRNHLLAIIDEFGLYANERRQLSPEGILERMHHDIAIEPIENQSPQRDVSSFKISFIAYNALLAQNVTSKLTSLFIEQNLETREHQATTTTNFLREQLEAAKTKLAEAEEEVRSFKMQHLGELPEQQPGNLAIIAGLEAQLQSTMASLSRAEEQRQFLESLGEYRTQGIASELARLKAERAALLDHYTPEYPAVIKLSAKIAETEASLKSMQVWRTSATEEPLANASAAATPAVPPPDDDISLGQLRGQLVANRLEIQNLSKDQKDLQRKVNEYQQRLNATPIREQQLAGILRNYDQLKQDYAELLTKESQSQMSADLEKRQEGQQFRLVDRPSLPTVPFSPNRLKMSLSGAAAGLGLGLALAFLLELKDSSFHSEEDLSQRFAFPLVVGIPLMLTPHEERSRTRRTAFEWMAGSGIVIAVVLAQLYEFYLYRHG